MNANEKNELKANLNQFTGTEQYHRWSSLFRNHVLTDGAKYLAEKAGAYWLMDAIASYHRTCMKDEMLQEMQFWTLTVKGNKATLICERDTDNVAIKQKIPFTDFPLESIKLYCAPCNESTYCVMLPSEY
jgi:hypothetical protein